MSLRLYFDEDSMDEDVLGPLRLRMVDVETTAEAGMLERDDDQQLEYATSRQRVLVTANAGHFAHLHREYLDSGQTHAGIIVIHQQRLSVGEIIRRLLRLIDASAPDEMRNQLVYLGTSAQVSDRS